MKVGAPLFMVFFLLSLLVTPCHGAVEAEATQKNIDVGNEIRGRTFYIQELDQGNKAGHRYHAYFQDDGLLTIKFSRKHWKYDRWEVDDKGTLCVKTVLCKQNKSTLCASKCGRFVKESATTYRWYNGDGQHRANFSLKGEGDRLP